MKESGECRCSSPTSTSSTARISSSMWRPAWWAATETALGHFAAAPVADPSVEINPAAACQIGRLIVSDGGLAPQIVQPPVVPSSFIARVPIGLYDVQKQFNGQGGF